MTHLYTLLIGGTVLPGVDEAPASAVAWAEDTVLLIGSDDDVLGISRGDSTIVDLRGAYVVPLPPFGDAVWPPSTTLEMGGPADLAVFADDPRSAGEHAVPIGLVRAGHVVTGSLAPPHGPRSRPR